MNRHEEPEVSEVQAAPPERTTQHERAVHGWRPHDRWLPARVAIVLGALLAVLMQPVRRRDSEAGMTTAEYAVGTIAAAAFAAVLYQVVTGDSIVSALGTLISKALSSL